MSERRFEQFEDEALYELEEATHRMLDDPAGFPGLRRELNDELLAEIGRRGLRVPERPTWTSE